MWLLLLGLKRAGLSPDLPSVAAKRRIVSEKLGMWGAC